MMSFKVVPFMLRAFNLDFFSSAVTLAGYSERQQELSLAGWGSLQI